MLETYEYLNSKVGTIDVMEVEGPSSTTAASCVILTHRTPEKTNMRAFHQLEFSM